MDENETPRPELKWDALIDVLKPIAATRCYGCAEEAVWAVLDQLPADHVRAALADFVVTMFGEDGLEE